MQYTDNEAALIGRPDFKLFLPAVRGCKAPRILSPGAAPSAREYALRI